MVQRRANRLKSLRALVTKRRAAFTIFFFFPQPPVVNFPIALQSAELQTSSPNPHVTRRWKSRSNGRQLNHEELHDVTPETQASGKGGRRVFFVFFFHTGFHKGFDHFDLVGKGKGKLSPLSLIAAAIFLHFVVSLNCCFSNCVVRFTRALGYKTISKDLRSS